MFFYLYWPRFEDVLLEGKGIEEIAIDYQTLGKSS